MKDELVIHMKDSKKKIRKGFHVSLWLLFFVPLIPTTSGSSGFLCDGPTNFIQVTVKQAMEFIPTYVYLVKNHHKSPIMVFALGDRDHEEMQIIPDNIPKTITSPKGWKGRTVFKEESMYMHILWVRQDPTSVIAPGKSLGGFKVEMPQPSEKSVPLFHADGTPVELLDMKKAPFRVYLEDGTCVWGRVQAEK